MLVALGQEPVEPMPPGVSGARMILIGPQERTESVPPPAPELLEVVPAGAGAVPTRFGGRFQLLSVEIYDTQMTVNWRLAPLPGSEAMFAEELAAWDHDMEVTLWRTRRTTPSGL